MRTWRYWQSVLAQSLIIGLLVASLVTVYRLYRTSEELVGIKWLSYYFYGCVIVAGCLIVLTLRLFLRSKMIDYYDPKSEADLVKLQQATAFDIGIAKPSDTARPGLLVRLANHLVDKGYVFLGQQDGVIFLKRKGLYRSVDWRRRISIVCLVEPDDLSPLHLAGWLDLATIASQKRHRSKEHLYSLQIVVLSNKEADAVLPTAACVVNYVPKTSERRFGVDLLDLHGWRYYKPSYTAADSYGSSIWRNRLRKIILQGIVKEY